MKWDHQRIKHWVFDLDNTLYSADNNLFAQVSARMGLFIEARFNIPLTQARARQKTYFQTYGTTLRGLMVEENIVPEEFLDFVHDIDFSVLQANPALQEALQQLDGDMIIYTNASVSYAAKVLEKIGLASVFDHIFAIECADYLPKPEAASYRKMVKKFSLDPARSVMVEDMAQNLVPASKMGMTTVWLPTGEDWSARGYEADYVDHKVSNLTEWLQRLEQ